MTELTYNDSLECQEVNENDFLFVIDMQNDFIPPSPCGVLGGDEMIGDICHLIKKFNHTGGHLLVTRDYHPTDHMSLKPIGPFVSHCVWGSDGSQIVPQIASQLVDCPYQEKIGVAFKALHPLSDSYGALPYSNEYGYIRYGNDNCCWTGGIMFPQLDLNTSLCGYPETLVDFKVISTTQSFDDFSEKIGGTLLSKYMQKQVRPISRFYLCGLAGDFCVLDTAINLHHLYPMNPVIIIRDCVRYIQPPDSL